MASNYLRYPYEAILDTTDFLLIELYSYDSVRELGGLGGNSLTRNAAAFLPTLVGQKKTTKNFQSSVILPMPSNIQDGNSVDYADSSVDSFTANVFSEVNAAMNSGGGRNGTLGSVQSGLENLLKGLANVTILDEEALKRFTTSLATQAANIPFGGNLTLNQVLARQEGQILNPNMELLLNGVNLRSFKFSFKMTPRDETEAKQIRSIIRTFKENMAPIATQNFIKTPSVFQLSYRKGPDVHPYLNLFKQCFLTDMSVNYTGEGIYATYPDGSPISYTMDLGFKELEPIYQGDYGSDVSINEVGF